MVRSSLVSRAYLHLVAKAVTQPRVTILGIFSTLIALLVLTFATKSKYPTGEFRIWRVHSDKMMREEDAYKLAQGDYALYGSTPKTVDFSEL